MALYAERNNKILSILCDTQCKSVLDVGCGDGRLVSILIGNSFFTKIGAVDISEKKIKRAKRRCSYNEKVCFFNQSFLEYNREFEYFEAFVLSEVIEHFKKDNLQLLFNLIFTVYHPQIVVITTPNRSYNVNYEVLYNGFRHSSHIFEVSENDMTTFIGNLSKEYTSYYFYTGFCDSEHASHLIKAVNNERSK